MAKHSSAEVIEAYRQRQGRRFPFTFADVSKGLLFLIMLAASIYVMLTGRPELPTLVELKTNTPTLTPSITPTASPTVTITHTPTETPDLDHQCKCTSPVILVVTATLGATGTATTTFTPTEALPPTETLPPTKTPTPTKTATPTASITPTPTQILYTVQPRDTLGDIALRFGISVEAIQAANNLDTTIIYIGQVLQIPKP